MATTAAVAATPFDSHAAYLRAREREGRILPDAVVARLPHVPRPHPLHSEWRMRGDSSTRLIAHLRAQRRPLTVVDLGCGNGWLAHRIAAINGAGVVGIDVNAVELGQARRVFGAAANLRFIEHDMLDLPLPVERADIVVLASAIQYVADPAALIARLLEALRPRGEVHVIDSPIYAAAELPAARARTRAHYAEIGVPEMAEAYHHHAWTAFDALPMDLLYRPGGARHRLAQRWLRRPRSPFPWLRFAHEGTPR